MPGPVSDSYDPEWGTSANGHDIEEAIQEVYDELAKVLDCPPRFILDIVHDEESDTEPVTITLPKRQMRILRFACERAKETI